MAEISDAAVQAATGRKPDHWFRLLDAADLPDHRARARWLQDEQGLGGWCAQTVTVEYERARGLRDAGQQSTGDYQASVQRTLPLEADTAWRLLIDADWMAGADWTEGAAFPAPRAVGDEVEVRAVRPSSLLRFWIRRGGSKSTVEVSLAEKGGRTVVRFRESGLGGARAREKAKERWAGVLEGMGAPRPEGRLRTDQAPDPPLKVGPYTLYAVTPRAAIDARTPSPAPRRSGHRPDGVQSRRGGHGVDVAEP